MTDQSLMDKSLRSVFVGNIPYEVTEEKLKDIFSEVGPVLSFKLVYDRETGKPKGYGFCEYKDQETALSAMRNLNGYEIGGRTLRVDNACTEKSRMEMQSLLQGPVVENPYGEAVQSDKAPEAISKAVASLPPEQMFELMKQMKLCVQNNPTEARAMLLQNPQLAYALLQAQVVMRILDPHTAVSMLHKANPILQPLMPLDKPTITGPVPVPVPVPAPAATITAVQPTLAMPVAPVPAPQQLVAPDVTVTVAQQGWTPAPTPVAVPRTTALAAPVVAQPAGVQFIPPTASGDIDHRTPVVDPRLTRMGDQDLRLPPTGLVAGPQPVPPVPIARDHREAGFVNNSAEHTQNVDAVESFTRDPRVTVADRFPRDPRERVDPRTGTAPLPVAAPRPPAPVAPVTAPRPAPAASTASPSSAPGAASDQEKAALIMQVLQLSDEQIAMLPPEQRQSILVLKEQIAKSTQR
ncbi:cleavage stimulation factor subunit 2 tau variant isoform X1 [Schistocerca americana]|uniref:cleavage stimulation factor subunit 2 tau variant isoform X1 n=1 Tax=Schistocerca americana TaxID=7009 RepID=UPI001F4F7026|nr:cleavage stimulation factor subunit 2 tau variant isoform X1 [Schistocerca americana]